MFDALSINGKIMYDYKLYASNLILTIAASNSYIGCCTTSSKEYFILFNHLNNLKLCLGYQVCNINMNATLLAINLNLITFAQICINMISFSDGQN